MHRQAEKLETTSTLLFHTTRHRQTKSNSHYQFRRKDLPNQMAPKANLLALGF